MIVSARSGTIGQAFRHGHGLPQHGQAPLLVRERDGAAVAGQETGAESALSRRHARERTLEQPDHLVELHVRRNGDLRVSDHRFGEPLDVPERFGEPGRLTIRNAGRRGIARAPAGDREGHRQLVAEQQVVRPGLARRIHG